MASPFVCSFYHRPAEVGDPAHSLRSGNPCRLGGNMTEVDTTTTDEEVVETNDDGDITVPKELRAAYNREKAENKKLKAQLMDSAYKGAGLDV